MKATKTIKVLFTYKEYESGGRSLKYDHDNSKEIVEWIAEDYLLDLFYRQKLNKRK